MNIPTRLLNLIRMMYKDLVTHLDYVGRTVGFLHMRSGIRRGSPLSGTTLRWLLTPSSAGTYLG